MPIARYIVSSYGNYKQRTRHNEPMFFFNILKGVEKGQQF